MTTKKKTDFRAMTSLTVLMSFVMIAFSGSILYLSPKGRVANWTGWTMAGLTKEGWGAAHTTMAILFLVACVIHLVYNWRPMLKYLKRPLASATKRNRVEMAAALAITLTVFLGTLWSVPPFSTVGAIGEDIKVYWETHSIAGPYIHAEDDTLVAFAEKIGRDENDLRERLAAKGYVTDDMTMKVKELAAHYDVSPATLFAAILRGDPEAKLAPAGRPGGGFGYGRMTLDQVCEGHGIPLDKAIARLREHGITANGSDTVRTLAVDAGMNPGELLSLAGIDTGH